MNLATITPLIAAFKPEETSLTEFPAWHVSIFYIFLIIFLVLLNAFFVAAEFALVKVRGSQLDTLIHDGNKHAHFTRKLTKNLDAYLSATQLGITIASIALGFTGEPFLNEILLITFKKLGWYVPQVSSKISFLLSYAMVIFLHVVLGELMPKSLAIRKSVITSIVISRPLAIFYWLFKPAIIILNGTANFILTKFLNIAPVHDTEIGHSAEELKLLVDRSGKTQVVTETERGILLNALDLNDLTVRDIMTPRNDVISLDIEKTFAQNLKIARSNSHTRFPLVKSHLDATLGLIHIKDILSIIDQKKSCKEPDINSIKRKLELVPEMLPLDKLLKFMLEKSAQLVLVVDEFGGAIGIVTLDNILAELVGDINDEFDINKESEFIRITDDEFNVKGSLALFELEEFTDIKGLQNQDVSTVGGYMTRLFGHLPKKGEQIEIEGYMATIKNADGRRIIEVNFKKKTQKTNADSNPTETTAKET